MWFYKSFKIKQKFPKCHKSWNIDRTWLSNIEEIDSTSNYSLFFSCILLLWESHFACFHWLWQCFLTNKIYTDFFTGVEEI
jgi:hypothetical protein